VFEIRKNVGMVFQNPDNQIVASIVEEDVAFAPRNFGVSEDEIPKRVKNALEIVGLSGFEKRSPHMLSGGQKQRAAIAGVLSCNPDIIIFDEATSALDVQVESEITEMLTHIAKSKTIIAIAHRLSTLKACNKLIYMKDGQIVDVGSFEELSDRYDDFASLVKLSSIK